MALQNISAHISSLHHSDYWIKHNTLPFIFEKKGWNGCMLSTHTMKSLQISQKNLYDKNSPAFLRTDKFTCSTELIYILFKIRVICDGGRVCLENVMHVWRAVNEDNGRQGVCGKTPLKGFLYLVAVHIAS